MKLRTIIASVFTVCVFNFFASLAEYLIYHGFYFDMLLYWLITLGTTTLVFVWMFKFWGDTLDCYKQLREFEKNR